MTTGRCQLARGLDLGVGQLAAARLDEQGAHLVPPQHRHLAPRPGRAAVPGSRPRSRGTDGGRVIPRITKVKAARLAQLGQRTPPERREHAAGARLQPCKAIGDRTSTACQLVTRAAAATLRAAGETCGTPAAAQARMACSVIRAAKGCVASITAATPVARRYSVRPCGPPKPPLRMITPSTGAASVRPASDRIGAAQPLAAMARASDPASPVPPRISTRLHQPAALPTTQPCRSTTNTSTATAASQHLAADRLRPRRHEIGQRESGLPAPWPNI